MKVFCRNAGNTDAGRLDGQDLVYRFAVKPFFELPAHLPEKSYIHLVVQKAVYLEYIPFFDNTVFYYSFFQKIHHLSSGVLYHLLLFSDVIRSMSIP